YVLLAGPVSTYVEGQFVGHGEVPTVAVGQSFTVGLGIDSSLRVARTLKDMDQNIQGGNRIAEFEYELALENFGDAAAAVRLFDRLPGTRHTDIKLTLVSDQSGLSKDADYRETEWKNGILRWDLDVPSAAIGTTAKKLTYRFRLEYDKEMSIVGMPIATTH
ncbi:MAG: DUF4139 domain-containing protein, partial [Phycisphaerae bacterium]|nr:DUF4139 domain-containing protein [Phycisphaerae bacterium]